MKAKHLFFACAVLTISGCQIKAPRNPNDPNQVAAERQPGVVKAYIRQMAEDVIGPAVAKGQISEEEGKRLMVEGARDYLKTVHFKGTPPNLDWMLAETYMTAHEWERAKPLVETALKVDTGDDRKVNDTLWLARCEAELGEVDACIQTARASFSAPREWKWPILYAVYLEIVPAAVEKKPSARIALAHLVEDAIKQHEAAAGSIENKAQHGWVVARDVHISRAWALVVKLYTDANRPDLAREAAAQASGKHPKSGVKSVNV